MSTLFYGSLSHLGLYISDQLLNAGKEVIGVSSAITKEEMEVELTNDMFLGRNAHFEFVEDSDNLSPSILESIEDCILLDGYFSENMPFVNQGSTEFRKRLHLIDKCPQIKKIILLSTTEIYGAKSGVITEDSPILAKTRIGAYYKEIEDLFQNTLSSKDHVELCIIRLPILYGSNQFNDAIRQRMKYDEQYYMKQDFLHYKDAVEGIMKALSAELGHGVHVFQLTSGKENSFASVEIFSNNKEHSSKDTIIFPNTRAMEKISFRITYE